MKEQCSGLRERKRRDTRRRIVDEAMKLVEAKGFTNVTVEDICEAADISRRTFFNYMDSKDQAVLGAHPFEITEDALEVIATTQSDNVLDLMFSQILAVPDAHNRERLMRRRAILSQNPALAGAVYVRKSETLTELGQAVEKHFHSFPGDRKLNDAPLAIEVNVLVDLFYAAVNMYLSNPEFPPTEAQGVQPLKNAAQFHTDLAKELSW
ncbi:TetR/AcrR family transcriptional regulator [Corynebacterium sp. UBA2622]|uniref:TetR/AcrR family transcriptional regulator n=1 Tax=Corynebacterium sp. UBA2622 TaxID=1946393 RepID=UPI0025BF993B|nr:TetR/AcrR family transcriptional regulator [Corynebacterium sp. UBA2622]